MKRSEFEYDTNVCWILERENIKQWNLSDEALLSSMFFVIGHH
jgi:hypothetical protein